MFLFIYMLQQNLRKSCKDDNETIDLKMYRIVGENQSKWYKYLLKTNAVDCNLNKEGNKFLDEIYKKQYEIETSKTQSILFL